MSGRILVVDDIATNRLILRAKLSSAYFDVLMANCGKQALEISLAELPDLILLDVMMPEMDGYETCRILKSHPETTHIPVIMVTAANSPKKKSRVGRGRGRLSKQANQRHHAIRARSQSDARENDV